MLNEPLLAFIKAIHVDLRERLTKVVQKTRTKPLTAHALV